MMLHMRVYVRAIKFQHSSFWREITFIFLVPATGPWENPCHVHAGSCTAEALAAEEAERTWLSVYQSSLLQSYHAWKGLLTGNSVKRNQFSLDNGKTRRSFRWKFPWIGSSGWWNRFLKELKKPPHDVQVLERTWLWNIIHLNLVLMGLFHF